MLNNKILLVAQWVMVTANKSDKREFNPGTNMVERTNSCKLSSDHYMHTHPYIYKEIKLKVIRS